MRAPGMIAALAAAQLLGCQGAPRTGGDTAARPADTVLSQARIYTVDAARPWAEAVAIKDGAIVYVGDDAGAEAWAGPGTRRHRLGHNLVLPGLVDAHTHPGLVTGSSDIFLLPRTTDRRELIAAVARQARSHPDLPILVGGYWPVAAFDAGGPRKEDLDRVVPDRPVVLFDDSGHSQWVNSRTLRMMGVDRHTPDPVPGLSYFARKPDGEPTGWAKEMAIRPFLQKMGYGPRLTPDRTQEFLDYLVSKGVTTLYDAGNGLDADAVYSVMARLDREGRLPLRYEGTYHVILPDQVPGAIDELKRLRRTYGGARLRFNTIKIHFDGVSEIGTSSVLEPFASDPKSRGGTVISGDALRDFILRLHQERIDLHLHTVGDAAARTALDAVEKARALAGGALDTRVTLCHLELLADADVPRFKQLGVVADATPHWNGGYFQGAEATLGRERYNRMYRVQPLLDSGATVTFSSDITDFIEWKDGRANPFFGMQIAHNRQEVAGGKSAPIRPPESERLRLEDLVKGYTLNGAYQLRLDRTLGSIEVGKTADLVVLDRNLFEVDRYAIHDVTPIAVLVEGRVVHGGLP